MGIKSPIHLSSKEMRGRSCLLNPCFWRSASIWGQTDYTRNSMRFDWYAVEFSLHIDFMTMLSHHSSTIRYHYAIISPTQTQPYHCVDYVNWITFTCNPYWERLTHFRPAPPSRLPSTSSWRTTRTSHQLKQSSFDLMYIPFSLIPIDWILPGNRTETFSCD